jgi:hypothetical protein
MTVEKSMHDLGLPGLLVLAPAAGLDLDASGYSLVRNEKFEQRLELACQLARRTLGSVSRGELAQEMARQPALKGLDEALLGEFPWLGD